MTEQRTSEPQTSTDDTSVTLPQIRLNERVAIFGGTGTGKSILAQVLYRSLPVKWWKIIVDITDSVEEPTAITFYDPTEIPWDQAYNLRFVPDVDVDLEEQINALFFNVFYHGACWVWLDEANEVTTAHHTAFGLRKVLLQGRKAFIGLVSCTPRPTDISKSIITQAQYLIIFPLTDFDDRIKVARTIGMMPDEFDAAISSLGEHEYLFYDVAYRSLYRVPAVPGEIVQDILNPPPADEVEIVKPESEGISL